MLVSNQFAFIVVLIKGERAKLQIKFASLNAIPVQEIIIAQWRIMQSEADRIGRESFTSNLIYKTRNDLMHVFMLVAADADAKYWNWLSRLGVQIDSNWLDRRFKINIDDGRWVLVPSTPTQTFPDLLQGTWNLSKVSSMLFNKFRLFNQTQRRLPKKEESTKSSRFQSTPY